MANAIPSIKMIDNDSHSWVTVASVSTVREGTNADKGEAAAVEPERSQAASIRIPDDERTTLVVASENGTCRLWAVRQLNGDVKIAAALNARDPESLGTFAADKELELGVRPATKSNPTGLKLQAY